MDEAPTKTKKLSMHMRIDMHCQLKAAAALKNISISLLVHRALYQYLTDIKKETHTTQ